MVPLPRRTCADDAARQTSIDAIMRRFDEKGRRRNGLKSWIGEKVLAWTWLDHGLIEDLPGVDACIHNMYRNATIFTVLLR